MEAKHNPAPFPYDKATILNDIFLTWVFPMARFYKENTPNLNNTIDLPKRFDYENIYKKVKS